MTTFNCGLRGEYRSERSTQIRANLTKDEKPFTMALGDYKICFLHVGSYFTVNDNGTLVLRL